MIIVDIETGGLDPRKNPIIAIGAVDFDTGTTFYGECRPRSDLTITEEALKVNGFTQEYMKTIKTSPYMLLENFHYWITGLKSDFTIAGENPSFDRDFLRENFKHFDLDNPFNHRTVDLHSIAYGHMLSKGFMIPFDNRKNKLNSDVIFVYTGIPAEPRPHNALNGAKYETEAFSRLINNKYYFPEFERYGLFPHGT